MFCLKSYVFISEKKKKKKDSEKKKSNKIIMDLFISIGLFDNITFYYNEVIGDNF